METKIEVCTVREVAVAFKVSQATVRRMITARTLPAIRVGRSVRIDRRVVAKLLAGGEVTRG